MVSSGDVSGRFFCGTFGVNQMGAPLMQKVKVVMPKVVFSGDIKVFGGHDDGQPASIT